jgi:prepilin peptidase CpaA
MQGLLIYLPLVAALVWAAGRDLVERRIKNILTLPLIAAGLVQSFLAVHTCTPGNAALGLGVGFTLGFALFVMGALGGGDVKLLAGVGAWVGPKGALAVFVLAALVGMVMVLVQALVQRRTGKLLFNSAVLAINLAHVGDIGLESVTETGRSCRSVEKPLPYAVPILVATCLLLAIAASQGTL